MRDGLNRVLTVFTGFGAAPRVSVRETERGYVIETEYQEEGGSKLSSHLVSILISMLWLAGLGYWLIVLPWEAGMPAVGGLLPAALGAAAVSLGWSMLRGYRTGMIEVDMTRERLCRGSTRHGATVFSADTIPFREVRDLVLRRPSNGLGDMALCARLHGQARPVEIARGDEVTLNALYHRLCVDLLPVEQRLQSRAQPGAGRPAARAIFPALGPHEIA